MRKQSAAAGQGRFDISNWRHEDQKRDKKKDDTPTKPVGVCTIVPKDKDLLVSCIDEGKLTLTNNMSIPYISGACNADAKIKL